MPRQPRLHLPETIFHVTARGVERRPIYVTDEDKRYFVSHLVGSLRAHGCGLVAYCLMPNHFHALVATGASPLGFPMHDLLTAYAVRFNAGNARDGHLFQSRFYSHPVQNLSYLQNALVYLHANPVRARLASSVAGWAWSSHQEWASSSSGLIDFARLEELVDIPVRVLREAYLERVAVMSEGGPKSMSLEDLLADTASEFGLLADALRDGHRGGASALARGTFIERASAARYSVTAIAEILGCTRAAVCMARKRRSCGTAR
ncbi:MAG: transposase [Elusimicrobiota bacterium]|nr:transposase [Elusimicrobiota bacterium]